MSDTKPTAVVTDALKKAVVQDKKPSSKERIAAQITGRALPDLAIRLSRTYAFMRGKDPAKGLTIDDAMLIDQSYVNPRLASWRDQAHSVHLTSRHDLELPSGVTIIMGMTGSGKTALTLGRMTLAPGNDHVCYIRYGEPIDQYFLAADPNWGPTGEADNGSGVYLAATEAWLAHRLGQLLLDRESADVIIVDSLRYLVFGSSGNTGKGGVNLTLFTDLTYLDVVASALGKSIVIVVNPMTDDESSYAFLRQIAASSVAATVDVKSPTELRITSRYDSRRWRELSLPGMTKTPAETGQAMSKITPAEASLRHLAR